MTVPRSKPAAKPSALFLAGHPALDFLNTRMRLNGQLVDIFRRDADVLNWLTQAGWPRPNRTALKPNSLLRAARRLRENLRALVEQRKAGRRGHVAQLNKVLVASPSHSKLVWNAPRSLKLERRRPQHTGEAILALVAESAAELVATGNFTLVKRCEDPTCVLWFADQTKSHRRRWCSMAICGNRNKVAAYRKRARVDSKAESKRKNEAHGG